MTPAPPGDLRITTERRIKPLGCLLKIGAVLAAGIVLVVLIPTSAKVALATRIVCVSRCSCLGCKIGRCVDFEVDRYQRMIRQGPYCAGAYEDVTFCETFNSVCDGSRYSLTYFCGEVEPKLIFCGDPGDPYYHGAPGPFSTSTLSTAAPSVKAPDAR
jgi:hypothetical protein